MFIKLNQQILLRIFYMPVSARHYFSCCITTINKQKKSLLLGAHIPEEGGKQTSRQMKHLMKCYERKGKTRGQELKREVLLQAGCLGISDEVTLEQRHINDPKILKSFDIRTMEYLAAHHFFSYCLTRVCAYFESLKTKVLLVKNLP